MGIIGVVAAMTIPNLIANIKAHQYRSKLKKSISTLDQAVLRAEEQYGLNFAGVSKRCDFDIDADTAYLHNPETHQSMCAIFNATLSGTNYLVGRVMKYNQNRPSGQKEYVINRRVILNNSYRTLYVTYILADGTLVSFGSAVGNGGKGCTIPIGSSFNETWMNANISCIGYIDVNGFSLPNKEIACSAGTTSANVDNYCVVNDKDITDIYPIVYHDSIVEPATNAAKYVFLLRK